MTKFLLCIIGFVLVVAILGVMYGFYRTWKTGRMAEYAFFTAGSVPSVMPDGLWNGSAQELGEISWKGKKFLGAGKGINVFEKSSVKTEDYQFTFFKAEGIDAVNVIRLDYGQKENPFWLRFIVDEMVSVGENKFLGFVYIQIIPGFPFRMGYFWLEK